MKLVADSNVLFTYFWKNSIARELFLNQDLELFSPQYSLNEIKKYSNEIIKKAKISKKEFTAALMELKTLVAFASLSEYSSFLKKAAELSPDKNDVDFVALSLKLNCAVWSNDKELAKGKGFKVLNTREIIELFD